MVVLRFRWNNGPGPPSVPYPAQPTWGPTVLTKTSNAVTAQMVAMSAFAQSGHWQ